MMFDYKDSFHSSTAAPYFETGAASKSEKSKTKSGMNSIEEWNE